jgi:hypothetical protein
MIPDGPPIITSRASCRVAPIRASRPHRSAMSETHDAPARVFPAPRPPRNNHVDHSPSGGLCWGLKTSGFVSSPRSGEGDPEGVEGLCTRASAR